MLLSNIHFIQRGWFNSNHILITRALQAPWLHDYAHRCALPCQLDPESLAQQMINEFIQRNLAREEEGILISLVPR